MRGGHDIAWYCANCRHVSRFSEVTEHLQIMSPSVLNYRNSLKIFWTHKGLELTSVQKLLPSCFFLLVKNIKVGKWDIYEMLWGFSAFYSDSETLVKVYLKFTSITSLVNVSEILLNFLQQFTLVSFPDLCICIWHLFSITTTALSSGQVCKAILVSQL